MGNLHRSSALILNQTAAATATFNGASTALRPGNDSIPDFQHEFAVVFTSTVANAASTPSLTVKLQTSWDGTTWLDVVAATAITADGTNSEYKSIAALKLGPFVRAVATISGTVSYTGDVRLISNAHFTVAPV